MTKGIIYMQAHIIKMLLEQSFNANFGFNASTVFNNMMTVISANIAPIMGLMGVMLGAGWVIQYFRRARKGSI